MPGFLPVYTFENPMLVPSHAARDALLSYIDYRIAGLSVKTEDDGALWFLNDNLQTWYEPHINDSASAVVTYADLDAYRAAPIPQNNQLIEIIDERMELVYSSGTGSGFADDGKTIIRQTATPSGNGVAYNTAPGAVAVTQAAFRAMVANKQDHVHVLSYDTADDGGGGIFYRDDSDTTTNDNVGTCVVIEGVRWKRVPAEPRRAEWYGTRLLGATVQAALNDMPDTGGTLVIGRGVWDLTECLFCYGKDNITVRGEGGINTTELDTTHITDWTSHKNWVGHSAALSISSEGDGGSGTTMIHGFKCHDLYFYDPRHEAGYSPGDARNGHLLAIDNCTDVEVSGNEFEGGVAEQIYITGHASNEIKRHVYSKNYCHNTSITRGGTLIDGTTAACIDTNTGNLSGITVDRNVFEEVCVGVLVLGQGLRVTNNHLHRVQSFGLAIAEDNGGSTTRGPVVKGNTFSELGKYNRRVNGISNTIGISIGNSPEHYTSNGLEDDMPIVSDTTFVDSVASGAGLICCNSKGPVKFSNIHIGSILTDEYDTLCADQAFSFDRLVATGTPCPVIFEGTHIKQPTSYASGLISIANAGLTPKSWAIGALDVSVGDYHYTNTGLISVGAETTVDDIPIVAVAIGPAYNLAAAQTFTITPSDADLTITNPAAISVDSYGFRTGFEAGSTDIRAVLDASNDWDVGGGASANYCIQFGGNPGDPYPQFALAGPRLRGRYVIDRRTTYNADGTLDECRPYGKSGLNLHTPYASNIGGVTSSTATSTLDVTGAADVYMNDATAHTVILITGGVESQRIKLIFSNANTTIQHGASTIVLAGEVDYLSEDGSWIELQRRSGIWFEERRGIGNSPAPFVTRSIAFPNNTSADTVVMSVPAAPTGADRFLLELCTVRLDVAPVGAGTAVLEIGTTAGGTDIILATAAISSATPLGVIAGWELTSLGTAMAATGGFSALLDANADLTCRVTSTGAITAGSFSVRIWGKQLI